MMQCRDTRGHILGVMCDLELSLVNTVLLHWSCQSHTRSVSHFQGRTVKESEDPQRREGALLNGSKTTIPPINCRPQTCLNGAGFLKTPAGWNWVKEDLMSHFLH